MKLILDDKNKKVFFDQSGEKEKIYTLINMGNYVGHRSRPWYMEAEPCWLLMFYDERKDKETIFHCEALCDEQGQYTRLIMEQNDIKRVVLLTGSIVDCDHVFDMRNVVSNDDGGLGVKYEGYEYKYIDDPRILLSEYMSTQRDYVSKAGEKIDNYPSDERINEFFENNDKLLNMLNSELGLN